MNEIETWVANSPPLRIDGGGAIRVGACRITLEVLLEDYKRGMTAEEIAAAYDTVKLADVHAVISHYLQNRELVDRHLADVEAKAEELRKKVESQPKYQETRARMQRLRSERLGISK